MFDFIFIVNMCAAASSQEMVVRERVEEGLLTITPKTDPFSPSHTQLKKDFFKQANSTDDLLKVYKIAYERYQLEPRATLLKNWKFELEGAIKERLLRNRNEGSDSYYLNFFISTLEIEDLPPLQEEQPLVSEMLAQRILDQYRNEDVLREKDRKSQEANRALRVLGGADWGGSSQLSYNPSGYMRQLNLSNVTTVTLIPLGINWMNAGSQQREDIVVYENLLRVLTERVRELDFAQSKDVLEACFYFYKSILLTANNVDDDDTEGKAEWAAILTAVSEKVSQFINSLKLSPIYGAGLKKWAIELKQKNKSKRAQALLDLLLE